MEVMQKLYVEGHVGCNQQQIFVRLMVREHTKVARKSKRIRLSKPTNGVNRAVPLDYTFVDLLKNILNFSFAFPKEYNEKLIVTATVDIAKNMMGSKSLAGVLT